MPGRAGLRVHGTTQARPAEVFAEEELARLLPAPATPYDLPLYWLYAFEWGVDLSVTELSIHQ